MPTQLTVPYWTSLWRMWGRSWSTRRPTCWPATGKTVPAPPLPARSVQDSIWNEVCWIQAQILGYKELLDVHGVCVTQHILAYGLMCLRLKLLLHIYCLYAISQKVTNIFMIVSICSWSCLMPWRCFQSTWTALWKLLPWSAAQSSQQTTEPIKGCRSWPWGWRTHSCCSTHASSHW